MLRLGLQWVVLVQTVLINLLVPDLLYQQLLELHFSINQLFLNIPENARVNHSVCPQKGDFMLFVTHYRVDLVGLAVDLLQIILVFLYFSFIPFNRLEISISDWTGLQFALIVHSQLDRFYDGFELELYDKKLVRICIFSFMIFLSARGPLASVSIFCHQWKFAQASWCRFTCSELGKELRFIFWVGRWFRRRYPAVCFTFSRRLRFWTWDFFSFLMIRMFNLEYYFSIRVLVDSYSKLINLMIGRLLIQKSKFWIFRILF